MFITILNNLGLLHPLAGWHVILPFAAVVIAMFVVNAKWMGVKLRLNFLDKEFTDDEKGFLKSALLTYPLWGTAQQLICAAVFATMVHFGVHLYLAVAITAMIFGYMHSPNNILIWPTMALGFGYYLHFSCFHNLYALGILHGILATVYCYHMPGRVVTTFRIWNAYADDQKNNG